MRIPFRKLFEHLIPKPHALETPPIVPLSNFDVRFGVLDRLFSPKFNRFDALISCLPGFGEHCPGQPFRERRYILVELSYMLPKVR